MNTPEKRIKALGEYETVNYLSEWGPMFKKSPVEFSNWINALDEIEMETFTNGNDTGWEIQYLLSEKMSEIESCKDAPDITMAMDKILKAEQEWLDLDNELNGVMENDIYEPRKKYLPENLPVKAPKINRLLFLKPLN